MFNNKTMILILVFVVLLAIIALVVIIAPNAVQNFLYGTSSGIY